MDSLEILKKCVDIQSERGSEYESSGNKERSMEAIVKAFNAVTGHNLSETEGWYFMEVLKGVRFFTAIKNGKVHTDSLIDAVSYASLRAEAAILRSDVPQKEKLFSDFREAHKRLHEYINSPIDQDSVAEIISNLSDLVKSTTERNDPDDSQHLGSD